MNSFMQLHLWMASIQRISSVIVYDNNCSMKEICFDCFSSLITIFIVCKLSCFAFFAYQSWLFGEAKWTKNTNSSWIAPFSWPLKLLALQMSQLSPSLCYFFITLAENKITLKHFYGFIQRKDSEAGICAIILLHYRTSADDGSI